MTNFNERTSTLLYKNIISHTLFSRGWCWLCERGELETGTDCFIWTQSSSDHSSTSFLSWLSCSTVGHWGPQSLQAVLTLASCPEVTPTATRTDSDRLCAWLYNCLTYTYFHFSSAYLHRCISWLTARSRVSMLHKDWEKTNISAFEICLTPGCRQRK